jgi:FlaA1/EpsC-like NDP-sugar epimerase
MMATRVQTTHEARVSSPLCTQGGSSSKNCEWDGKHTQRKRFPSRTWSRRSAESLTAREGCCRFDGKVICITGAGGNFGRAAVLFFAKEGAHIVALDAVADPLAQTLQEHASLGTSSECLTAVCDITKVDQARRCVCPIHVKAS